MLPALLLAACSGGSVPDDPSLTTSLAVSEAPPEAAGLVVAFRERAAEGVLPTELAFTTNLPIFPRELVGKPAPEGTRVLFDPPIEGVLTVAARDVMVFTPAAPLQPATTYTVRVEAIGKIAETPEDWRATWQPRRTTFTTPAFGFQRATLPSWDEQKGVAEVVLAFTGPVDAAEVERRLGLSVGGRAPGRVTVSPGSVPHAVVVRVSDALLFGADGSDRELKVTIAPGVPMVGPHAAVAGAGEATLALTRTGPDAKVLAVKVREGMSGFYLDVYCDDDAVPRKRWWWDRVSWEDYRVSERCMPDEDAIHRAIHLSPPMEFTVAPSDAGFRVFAPFTHGPVQFTLDAGARTVSGGAFRTTWQQTLDVPLRTPRVDFVHQGRYLPRSAWTNLPLRATNVPEVEVTVRHVPPENLVYWMTGGEPADERVSNVVAKRRIRLPSPVDEPTTAWIDVRDLVPQAENGVYELAVRGWDPTLAEPAPADPDTGFDPFETEPDDDRGVSRAYDAARILLTDMHLVAKLAAPEAGQAWASAVRAWALNVHDNRAIVGAELSLVRPSGKVVGRCTTGADGGCTIPVAADPLDPTAPVALIARKGTDLTYLKFADLELSLPGDTTGESETAEATTRAALWPERGVYRPGDTAHLSTLVRDARFQAPGELPVLLRLFDPRGKETRRKVVDVNEAGLATWDLSFGDYAPTGRYRVTAEVGGVEVGQTTFQVEEFVPERMKVTAKATRPAYRLADAMEVEVEARWLFGGSAEGSEAQLSCEIVASTFSPAQNGAFHYGPARLEGDPAPKPLTLGSVSATLGAEGRATLSCPTATAGSLEGPSELVAQVSVLEGQSGRATVHTARAPVHPADRYVGLRTTAREARVGVPLTVQGVVVDWDGARVQGEGKVEVELVRLEEEFGWMWDEVSDDQVYRRMLRRVKEGATEATVRDGAFSVVLTPAQGGAGYLVVARHGGARTELYVPGSGYRWWWSSLTDTVDQTPRPQAPTPIALTLPPSARVGDRVEVRFDAPFRGRALLTVESRGVKRAEWLDVEPGPVAWTFPVEAFEPNLYVSALVLKDPHLESDASFLPDRAFGVQSLRIEPTAYTQALKLGVPAEVKPGDTLKVDLDLGPVREPAWAVVAAVDEGILSLTGFADPDPATAIFARRALGVRSFETVGWTLLHQPAGPSSRTGGDAAGRTGRVQMVKPVALWSGPVSVPASGRATVSFPIPTYRGSLRVMAVVATPTRMGHAAASVVVRDPLVLQTTLPRFLVQGDQAQVPVMVTNLTGAPTAVTVRMTVQEKAPARPKLLVDVAGVPLPRAAGVEGAQEGRLQLGRDAQGTVVFRLRGDRPASAVTVRVEARAGNHVSTETLDLPVVAADPEVEETTRVALKAGPNALDAAFQGWQPGSDRTTVWVTPNPYAQALTHLKSLIRYPYGCVEQTTSSTRPLLYVRTLAPDLVADPDRADTLDDMVQHGIQRVVSMQTPSGGFGYWPGAVHSTMWATIYATHLLLDARDAGYPVPEEALADATRWIGLQVEAHSSRTTLHDRAYGHYLLARAGRPQLAGARRVLDDAAATGATLHAEDRYLAQAAVWLGGDRRYEKELRHPPVPPIDLRRENTATYWSDLREAGLILSVYRDLFQGETGAESLADAVAAALARRSQARWYTTQELAWGLSGLARSVAAPPKDLPTPRLLAGGTTLPAPTSTATGQWTWQLSRATQTRDLAVDVDGLGAQKLWAMVTVRGQRPATAADFGDHGVAVDRTYVDARGRPVDPRAIRLGDVLYVHLRVENQLSVDMPNVAVVDRLPAGLEIENPRLGRGALPETLHGDAGWEVDHMNVRDDRLEVFGELGQKQAVDLYYQVRAVTAGTFTAPDVRAEAMYDPSWWSRAPAQTVEIRGPWEGKLR